MFSHTDLKKGTLFIYNSQPYEVLDFSLNFQGRGSSTAQIKMKNLITGSVLAQNFKGGDSFEEAEIEKKEIKFLYENKDQYFFCEANNPAKRFPLSAEQIGSGSKFIKPNLILIGLVFNEKIINVILPVKIQLKVNEAAAYLRAGRAEAGTKEVVLETGAKIQAPSFIKEGDVIEINTENESYVRRVE
ncbi:MAG: elongation factor P [Candidatus Pacebacteria bacterium]|nr:elongation factor P [Candidatus Paceibacterota bacterium]